MLDTQTAANASIDQSVKLPDYFSCHNCVAAKGRQVSRREHLHADRWGNVDLCEVLREEGVCAKQMLGRALESGAVRIVLHLPMKGD